jgi:hypothetical protein
MIGSASIEQSLNEYRYVQEALFGSKTMERFCAHYTNIKFHFVTDHVCLYRFALGHSIPPPVATNIALVCERPLNNANDREK